MFNCIIDFDKCQENFYLSGAFDVKNVIYGLVNKGGFRCLCQFVIHFFAFAPAGQQSGLFEQPQVVGNGRCAHINAEGNVIDADFTVAQQPENAQAGRVADELKSFGSFFKRQGIRHIRQDFFNFSALMAVQAGNRHFLFISHLASFVTCL